ncbi:TonB-dependent receptor [Acetobacter sp. TBRC 12305]|nr:TonB-dependent receptor [Acetobacter garciniae]MBX0344129.1 TonB-dependent receptor [Acetobacter garciniae]
MVTTGYAAPKTVKNNASSDAKTVKTQPAVEKATPVADHQPSEEQLIVTGTRDPRATVRQSLSPISVVTTAQLLRTGSADLREALVQLAPSVSMPAMSWGSAGMAETLNMHGLTSNQTLILVNGKRRDTSAIFQNNAGPQFGTTPVDLGMLPRSAIDHIEILDDGAAAQYGSDAIAGVINIILKKNKTGLTLNTNNGGYYAGDGFTSDEYINYGMNLKDRGFLSLSAEAKFQDHTDRTPASWTGDHNNHILGNPRELRETIGYNMEYEFLPHLKLYSFSTYGHRNSEAFQYNRAPGSANDLPTVHPGGYSPQMANNEDDFGVTAGLKGQAYFDWDVSTTYGEDINHDNIFESGNTSLYALYGTTPTFFHQNTSRNSQWTTNVDFRRSFKTPLLAGPINLSFGAEYRYETWRLLPGDPASYYGSGTQSQFGTSPANSVNSHRDVTSGYIDISDEILPKWRVDLAGRYEHYTNSQDAESGKISTRYDISPKIAIRGTVSNGFRAPTLAESNYNNIGSSLTAVTAILRPGSTAAKALGGGALKPERSTNFSAGIVFSPVRNLHINIDAYQISIRDRIVQGGTYVGAPAVAALAAQGFSIPAGISTSSVRAYYFANGASTRTQGVDIGAQYLTNLNRFGRIDWDVSLNLNNTKITKVNNNLYGNPILNAQQQSYLKNPYPKSKLIFGGVWSINKWSFAVHEIRYGHGTSTLEYYYGPLAYSGTQFLRVAQTARYQTNLQVSYDINKNWRVSLGGINVGNEYPRKMPRETRVNQVLIYDVDYQGIGFNGGYYYFQAAAQF